MKYFLLSRQAIRRFSLLPTKPQNFCRNFSAITSSISHSDRHLRSYGELNPFKDAKIPRPIFTFGRYFHCTRESRLSESSVSQIDDTDVQEEDNEDEDGTINEFLSRFVWIMRGKVSEAYPDCDKKMIDGMLCLIVEKVVEEIERGGFNKVGSAPPSPSSEFSDDLWSTIWEVSNTVLKDMEKERKKEKMKQYVQSPEVMEMCRFAGEIGIRGDLLRELRFKWAREKMEDAEFYNNLEQQRDLENSIGETKTENAEEGSITSDEIQPQRVSLPKRKGKFKYKIYGLELSDPKWVEMADKIHEAEEDANMIEPKPVTGKCKLVMEKLESLEEEDDPSGLLAEWVELLEPHRVDWIALLNQLRERNTNIYLKVSELVLDEKSFKASMSDYSKLIYIYAKDNRVEDVERVLQKMSQKGIFPDILTANALVHMYSKTGNLERATEAFESLKSYGLRPDEKIYTSMIMGYVNAGKPKLAERLLRDMEGKDLKCSEEVYIALLRAFAQAGDANAAAGIYSAMQFQIAVYQPSFEACSLLVEAYMKSGQADQAKTSFDQLRKLGHKPDDNCIANVIKAYKGDNSLDKALKLLLQLEKDGVEIGVITYTVLVDWMANLGLTEEAEQLLVKISQLGEAPPLELQVSLCRMYSIIKNEKKTLQILGVLESKKDQMGPNEYEKVITGLKMGGFEKDARRMFKHMEARKFKPSERLKIDMVESPRTFVSGYSRMGR